jgi:hypothetical protein
MRLRRSSLGSGPIHDSRGADGGIPAWLGVAIGAYAVLGFLLTLVILYGMWR